MLQHALICWCLWVSERLMIQPNLINVSHFVCNIWNILHATNVLIMYFNSETILEYRIFNWKQNKCPLDILFRQTETYYILLVSGFPIGGSVPTICCLIWIFIYHMNRQPILSFKLVIMLQKHHLLVTPLFI